MKLIVDTSFSCIFYRKVCNVAGCANNKFGNYRPVHLAENDPCPIIYLRENADHAVNVSEMHKTNGKQSIEKISMWKVFSSICP